MERMTLEWFMSGTQDMELRQYRVLQGLKGYYQQFSHNRLYPYLAELIQLLEGLESLAQKRGDIRRQFPQRLAVGIDARNGRVATAGWLDVSDVAATWVRCGIHSRAQ